MLKDVISASDHALEAATCVEERTYTYTSKEEH